MDKAAPFRSDFKFASFVKAIGNGVNDKDSRCTALHHRLPVTFSSELPSVRLTPYVAAV